MEEHGRRHELALLRAHCDVLARKSYQFIAGWLGQPAKGIHYRLDGHACMGKKLVRRFLPSSCFWDTYNTFEGGIDDDVFDLCIGISFASKSQSDVTAVSHFGIDAHRPQQHRRDPRSRGRPAIAHDEKWKSHIQAIDAGVAFVEQRVRVQRPQPSLQAVVVGEGCGIDIHNAVRPTEQLIENLRRRYPGGVEFGEIDPD
ncbi:hypothetical protein ES703_116242 [subsurface metagenome]